MSDAPREPPPTPACSDCAYWSALPVDPNKGECRRLPPQGFYDFSMGARSLWPTCHATDWCGSFSSKTVALLPVLRSEASDGD